MKVLEMNVASKNTEKNTGMSEVLTVDFKNKRLKKSETFSQSGKLISFIEIEHKVVYSLTEEQKQLMGPGFSDIINILLKKNG